MCQFCTSSMSSISPICRIELWLYLLSVWFRFLQFFSFFCGVFFHSAQNDNFYFHSTMRKCEFIPFLSFWGHQLNKSRSLNVDFFFSTPETAVELMAIHWLNLIILLLYTFHLKSFCKSIWLKNQKAILKWILFFRH